MRDARAMHDSALEQLAAGDIRDAAEKAWCATKRATEALLLAVNGEVPPTTVGVPAGFAQWAGTAKRPGRYKPGSAKR